LLHTWQSAPGVTSLTMCAHTGTHVDAPAHFISGGGAVESLPLDALIGPAHVVRLNDAWPACGRLLFRTRNSEHRWWEQPFQTGFDALTPEQARRAVEQGVRLVGIDYLSIGADSEDGAQTHRILLAAGIVILEGLNLCAIAPGEYDLVCLPLLLQGADGAPARAALRRRYTTSPS
jgi:arylformamidase